MAKNEDSKPAEVTEAEQEGGETFEPSTEERNDTTTVGQCPDCKGLGIRNPDVDTQVCQTCQGTGKA